MKALLFFLGCKESDHLEDVDFLVKKLCNLRMFSDKEQKMNLSIQDINGSVLIVSQFTLYANLEKGRRPSFIDAMEPEKAKVLYNAFVESVQKYVSVQTGVFGADMQVHLVNDGPVTFFLQSMRR